MITSTSLKVVKKFFPAVKKVVDATRNAAIEVTMKDVRSAAVRQHDACAFAVACKHKFHLDGVIISRSVAYLVKGDTARRFMLPESVKHEIVSFDRGAGFAVGKYALQSVPKSSHLGSRERPQYSKTRETKQKRFRHITTSVRTVLGGQAPEE